MRHTALLSLFTLSLWICLTNYVGAQPSTESPRNQYELLLKQFAKDQAEYAKRLEAAPDRAAQTKLFRESSPYPVFAGRFLELAKKHPTDAAAYDCLLWIVRNAECGPLCEAPYSQAVEMLARHYAQHKDGERCFDAMLESAFLSSAKYLEAVFAKHPDRDVRGRAGYQLAMFLKQYCATMDRLREQPENAKNAELFMGPALVKTLTTTDPAPLLRQAEEVLDRVRKEYALVEYKDSFLVKLAERELFEMRHLAIGKSIPEIDGEDTAGNKLKLSDYRGKVVVLVFWGTWCGHCVAMLPQERALVKKYADQPFALLGINNDQDRAKLKPFFEKQQITWPSFADATDTISTLWNIKGWPAVFVVDAKGVIRHRGLRGEPLNRAVEQLVKEAKAAN
ncbi:MAG: TlpA family protein disulfide reductase [Planctomycetes bacterium]|nr:TlpA family protein disulfide reductase [Planctomycetota bacterium]